MTSPLALLGLLSSASRLVRDVAEGPERPGEFEGLLERAQKGELDSGLEVSVASDAGIDLDKDQLDRLAHAADKLEAAGVTEAIVSLDGLLLRFDVANRRVIGKVSSGDPVGGVDGFMKVKQVSDDGVVAAHHPGATALQNPPLQNPSLMNVLANSSQQQRRSA